MFCPNCGKEMTDGAKFCIYCGKSISTDTSQELTFEDSPAKTVIPDAQDQDVGLEVEDQNIRTSISEKKKSSHPKIIIGLAAVAVCIAIGVGLRYYHDYQLKVKMAEIYKERFGIEIDPNDLTLYDNLQDALADDSWQGGNSSALTEPPTPEEGMMTTTEYDRDGNIVSVTTQPIEPATSDPITNQANQEYLDYTLGLLEQQNDYGWYVSHYTDSSGSVYCSVYFRPYEYLGMPAGWFIDFEHPTVERILDLPITDYFLNGSRDAAYATKGDVRIEITPTFNTLGTDTINGCYYLDIGYYPNYKNDPYEVRYFYLEPVFVDYSIVGET